MQRYSKDAAGERIPPESSDAMEHLGAIVASVLRVPLQEVGNEDGPSKEERDTRNDLGHKWEYLIPGTIWPDKMPVTMHSRSQGEPIPVQILTTHDLRHGSG